MPTPLENAERAFVDHERLLWAILYRMTGSAADAEDLVQETFVRALERPPADANRPVKPWLVTVAMNLARDHLRKRKRRAYVGQWLPAPVEDELPAYELVLGDGVTTEGRYDLIESVSLAFLVALEALTPKQRAVLILRDVFDYSVAETCGVLEMSESNVKTTLHRARRAMADYDEHRMRDLDAKNESVRSALESFLTALAAGDSRALESVLCEDVVEMSDSAGEFVAARNAIVGAKNVTRFFLGIAPSDPRSYSVRMVAVNGRPACVVEFPGAGERRARRFVMAVDVDRRGRIRRIWNVLASAKLAHVRFQSAGSGPR